MTALNYRKSPLSAGSAGKVQGGDRLPWVLVNGIDNHQPLSAMVWQVHVYGEAPPELETWCAQHHIPLHVFFWQNAYHKAGMAQNAPLFIAGKQF